MQKLAEDRREITVRIGHADPFFIPFTKREVGGGTTTAHFGDVTTIAPFTEEVVMQVKQALESSGYQVALVDSAHPVPNPSNILKVNIKEFYFASYNGYWPLVSTGGY